MSNNPAPILIGGGTIQGADPSLRGDVLLAGGTIAAIGVKLDTPADTRVLDAGGLLVMPDGIDPRTHMETPFMGEVLQR